MTVISGFLELVKKAPHLYQASNIQTKSGATGLTMLPKASCDVMKCETTRLLKLSKDRVYSLQFIIPRKNTDFQEDLFPDDYAGKPSQTADEYFSGKNSGPVLMSMDPANSGNFSTAKSTSNSSSTTKSRSAEDVQGELNAAYGKISSLEQEIEKLERELEQYS